MNLLIWDLSDLLALLVLLRRRVMLLLLSLKMVLLLRIMLLLLLSLHVLLHVLLHRSLHARRMHVLLPLLPRRNVTFLLALIRGRILALIAVGLLLMVSMSVSRTTTATT